MTGMYILRDYYSTFLAQIQTIQGIGRSLSHGCHFTAEFNFAT